MIALAGEMCVLPSGVYLPTGSIPEHGYLPGRPSLEAHHFKGKKAHPRLRYDVENGVSLCPRGHDWAHANRDEFKAWFKATYPERWQRLEAKARRESRLT